MYYGKGKPRIFSNATKEQGILCYYCQNKGHFAWACPKKLINQLKESLDEPTMNLVRIIQREKRAIKVVIEKILEKVSMATPLVLLLRYVKHLKAPMDIIELIQRKINQNDLNELQLKKIFLDEKVKQVKNTDLDTKCAKMMESRFIDKNDLKILAWRRNLDKSYKAYCEYFKEKQEELKNINKVAKNDIKAKYLVKTADYKAKNTQFFQQLNKDNLDTLICLATSAILKDYKKGCEWCGTCGPHTCVERFKEAKSKGGKFYLTDSLSTTNTELGDYEVPELYKEDERKKSYYEDYYVLRDFDVDNV